VSVCLLQNYLTDYRSWADEIKGHKYIKGGDDDANEW